MEGFTVFEGSVVYPQAALPVPVVRVAYRFVEGPWLQPHHVAGWYVARPRLEPALQDRGAEVVEDVVWIHPGGFSSTPLSGQGVPVADVDDAGFVDALLVILAGVDLGVVVVLVEPGAALKVADLEVAVDDALLELPMLDPRAQEPTRFIRSKSRLLLLISNVRAILYCQLGPLVAPVPYKIL